VVTGRSRGVAVTLLLAVTGCAVSPTARQVGYQTSNAEVSITRIAHGSVIVGMAGQRLLVDPWFYPRWIFRQSEPLGLLPDALPPLDAILITRDGSGTLDTTALRTLAGRVATVIAPPEAVAALGELGFTTVTAVATGSSATLGPLTVHATADGGYVVVQDATRVFVAADPADVAATTAEVARFAPLTVALLPIGGRRLLGLRRGLDPEGAAAWAAQLDANRTIPYRYGLA
jgi:L-ascorbate metabolism protein UlaG (beta-lactamase superfamily)